MKKLLLMLVVMLVSSVSLQAQNFDEENLVGKGNALLQCNQWTKTLSQ